MNRLGGTVGGLRDRAVQRARRVRRERLAPTRPEVVEGVHGHGYLVRPDTVRTPLPDVVRTWPQERFGTLTVHRHPRTVCSVATDGPLRAVFLGHPVDVDAAVTDGAAIAGRLVGECRPGGLEAAIRYAVGLGGRWTLLLQHGQDGEGLTVLPDALASQRVHWSRADGPRGGPVVGSAAALVAGAAGAGGRLRAGELVEFTASGTRIRAVPQAAGGGVPQAPTKGVDPDAAEAALMDRLREHVRLLTSFGPPVLTVDGSPASRLLLEAFSSNPAPTIPATEVRAITCFTPESGPSAEADGLFAASRSCFEHGLPHRVLRSRPPGRGSTFDLIHRLTFPGADRDGPGQPGWSAYALWSQLPHDIVHLHPAGGPADLDRPAPDPVTVAAEGDLAHRVLLPYNDRAILGLLAMTDPVRRSSRR